MRRTVIASLATFLVIFALGGPLGLLWAWLAPDVPVVDAGPNGIVINDPSPEEFIAADGWFTLLGFGFGILVAVLAWLLLRRDRGPFLLLGVVAGALGAGYLAAPWFGEMIGQGAYDRWQQAATQGATYLAPPEVHSLGPKLVPAFAAAVILTLLAGWSNDPDLEAPGAKPGYGPNADAYYPYPGWSPTADPNAAHPTQHDAAGHDPTHPNGPASETTHPNGPAPEPTHLNGPASETIHPDGPASEAIHRNGSASETTHRNGPAPETTHPNSAYRDPA